MRKCGLRIVVTGARGMIVTEGQSQGRRDAGDATRTRVRPGLSSEVNGEGSSRPDERTKRSKGESQLQAVSSAMEGKRRKDQKRRI